MNSDSQIKALLIALSSNPTPALTCINRLTPEMLCFVLPETQKKALESNLQPQIAKMPQKWDWIITEDPWSFLKSHQALTQNLPNILRTWGVQPGELVVDLTSATPGMAAAMVLASRPFTSRIVLLSEPQIGLLTDSTVPREQCQAWEESNPWNEEAIQVSRDAAVLFSQGAFLCARKKFQQIETLVSGSLKPLYHALGDLAEGYALWEGFRYREAWEKLKGGFKAVELASVWGGPPGLSALLASGKNNLSFLESIIMDPENVKLPIAHDLLAHAKRRAVVDHHFESAILAVIRALEAYAQHQLWKKHNVRTWDVDIHQLPQALQEPCRACCLDDIDGKYKISLYTQFRALAGLGDPMGQTFLVEWPKMKPLLDAAYQSILGHGFQTTKIDRFHQLYALVVKLTKVNEIELPKFPSMSL